MGILASSHLGLLALFVLLALLLKTVIINQRISNANANKLPPGPWRLPIIGSMHHLIGEHPHRKLLHLARTYGPLLYLKLGEIDLVVVTSAELASEVIKTHDILLSSRPELLISKIISYNSSGIAFCAYSKYWSQMRKICTVNLLSQKRIKSFDFIRQEEGNHLVEKIRTAKGLAVNLSEMLFSVSYATFSKAAFGKWDAHQQQRFLMVLRETIKFASGFSLADLFPSLSFLGSVTGLRDRMESVHRVLDEILSGIFLEHQKKAREKEITDGDFVDVLLSLKRDGELDASITIDSLKAVVLDLFVAATETTSSTLTWAMTELIRHPKVMQKAQAELRDALQGKTNIKEADVIDLSYLNMVIKETLRFRPATPLLLPRTCFKPIELSGYRIPAGSRVVFNAWALMRDPTHWEDPETFEPERFRATTLDYKGANFQYIPFGAGRRICPGMTFALTGIVYWLALLLYHFHWEPAECNGNDGTEVEEDFGLVLNRKFDLCLIATPHK